MPHRVAPRNDAEDEEYIKTVPGMIPKVRSSMFFGIGKVLGEAQQIIGRHMEKHAKSLNICQTWRILVVFNIGNFSLGHIYGLAQLP